MLLAHIAPAYFAVEVSKSSWSLEWGPWQRATLWIVAVSSTIAPDTDVIVNVVTKGFAGHSTLWTHSVFPYLILALGYAMLKHAKIAPFLSICIGLMVVGGLSHLVLDVIAHGTPLLYPISPAMFGFPPSSVVEGGLVAYLTHPILLIELVLVGLAAAHWIANRGVSRRSRNIGLAVLFTCIGIAALTYIVLLPFLKNAIVELALLTAA